MFNLPKQPRGKGESRGYQRHKRRAAAVQAHQSAEGRDIGALPSIADLKRREKASKSLRVFCETYIPEAFYFEWSPDHLRAIARIEEVVTLGALYAFAMPRGSGKTTLCRAGTLWAVSQALRRYPFIIGANAEKAEKNLDAIKTWMRFLPLYTADFPEISYAIRQLDGIANRAKGQLCDGQPTLIHWSDDRVVLPTVPLPPNWPTSWDRKAGDLAPTSGIVIGCSGLTGQGIRGSVHTTITGEQLRPDMALLDDPQTDESANSPGGNAKRESLVSGAVLGMAGPGKTIAAIMPCTVIRPGDFVDRILDRQRHPMWRGERTSMLAKMPTNMTAWEKHFEVFRRCAGLEPPDYTDANKDYIAHRAVLDAGGAASWAQRKSEGDVSAIQHAMYLFARNPQTFWAEYQNRPLAHSARSDFLDATQIAEKLASSERGVVPVGTTRLTAFIDVQMRLLYYAVVAWQDGFTGTIIDYGTYPDQKRNYFTLTDARNTLDKVYKGAGVNGAIYAGLIALVDQLAGRGWAGPDGMSYRIDRLLIDAGWGDSTGVVYKVCRETPHAAIVLPSFGRGLKAGDRPMNEWKKEQGEQVGHDWRVRTSPKDHVRYVLFDSNAYLTMIHQRLATAIGDLGCLTLHHADPSDHRMIADHLTAAVGTKTQGRGRELVEWKLPPNKPDNHLADCVVGCTVAASIAGVTTVGHREKPAAGSKRRRATGAWAK